LQIVGGANVGMHGIARTTLLSSDLIYYLGSAGVKQYVTIFSE
jgi:hypothetical protein